MIIQNLIHQGFVFGFFFFLLSDSLFGFSTAHHLQLCNLHSGVQLEGFSACLPNIHHLGSSPSREHRCKSLPCKPLLIQRLVDLPGGFKPSGNPWGRAGGTQSGFRAQLSPPTPGWVMVTPNSSSDTQMKDHFLTSPNQYLLDGDLKTPDSFPRPKPLDK